MRETGCHDPFPRVAAKARVVSNREIAPSVYELVIGREGVARAEGSKLEAIPAPVCGQFFMLRAAPSGVLLGRPISVYRFDGATISFLILKKGPGTAELCDLRAGDFLDLVGPIGNRFLSPDELARADGPLASSFPAHRPLRVAVIGGGIGVAPVAGFALALDDKSFDFYASFRSTPYGLDGIAARARRLVVTTEDGSAGVKGMLPAAFDPSQYDLVYACGPTPMLRYIKESCAKVASANVGGAGADVASADAASANAANASLAIASAPLAFISLEEHMACGAGACLGCTVRTVNGNRRCCVDGPVFNAAEVIL